MEDYVNVLQKSRQMFSFENSLRNEFLLNEAKNQNFTFPILKTGTTIVGIVCGNDGVILAADTRTTSGDIIADSDFMKIFHVYKNMGIAGAGSCADFQHLSLWASKKIELHALNLNRDPRVDYASSILSRELFGYRGYKECVLLVGGVDINGPQLYSISPDGFLHTTLYEAKGSGSLAALPTLENGYHEKLSIEEGIDLVTEAVRRGIVNDMGSGATINALIITKDGGRWMENILTPSSGVMQKGRTFDVKVGTTTFLRQRIENIRDKVIVETLVDNDVEEVD